ncbi:ATP-binding protein [Spirosoma sp. SC4-14]|uniref:ATP-binding protein n=1 Tax=Spirosoma sp. SC4-14 TaxID=3128900 RepID=UPI0030CA5C3E
MHTLFPSISFFSDTNPISAISGMVLFQAQRNSNGQLIDFRLLMLNTPAILIWERPQEELVGRLLSQLVAENDAAYLIKQCSLVVEFGRSVRFDMENCGDSAAPNRYTILAQKQDDGVMLTFYTETAPSQTEQALQQQTELLHSIQNTSQMGISVYTAVRNEGGTIVDFQTIFRNKASADIFRQPIDQIKQATLLQIAPSLAGTDLVACYCRVAETRQPEQFEYHQDSDTTEVWYDISVQPWGDGIIVNSLETTELRKSQRDKLYQSTILQQVVDNTQAGLLLARPVRNDQAEIVDFQYVLTNEYNARITGRSVSQMTNARISDLFPGWQHSDLFRHYVETVESKQPKRIIFFYEEFGMKGWFDGSFTCVDGCIFYTYTDVTAFKEAELIQQQNADLLEQVMNMTPAAIVLNQSIRNEAGEIIDLRMMKLNQMAADILQNPIEKIQYRRISRYIPGSLETPLFEQCKQVIETGKPIRLEVPWAGRWYDFSVARFGDGVVLSAQDITPMRHYQHQLERTNIELKRSNENLQSFAFIASHDLQEPLRKIISFSDILTTQYTSQLDTYATGIINRMNASASRMRLLIQDLLAYSQVETRQSTYTPVSIADIIQELQEHELWERINQRQAEIHLQELPTIMADQLQMRQLFQNLLSNAIKFCPNDTIPVISVSCQLIEQGDLPAGLAITPNPEKTISETTRFAEISVTDNGIGFDEKYLDRIFQVFQRLHGRSEFTGSGIGLAICQKIVERHDGAITASSQPDQGSTFRVYLPAQR